MQKSLQQEKRNATMDRVVLDTNVIISAALSNLGNPARIVEMVSDGVIDIYYSDDILAEYAEVLSRDRLGFSIDKQVAAIDMIIKNGFFIDPIESATQLPDMDDIIFYDAAKSANAYLITGNIKHYPADNTIMTPAQFLELVDEV